MRHHASTTRYRLLAPQCGNSARPITTKRALAGVGIYTDQTQSSRLAETRS